MTKLRDTLLVGAALILGTVATAGAADLNRGSLKDGYMPAIAQSPTMGPAWYVRLDGGIASFDRPTMVLTETSGYSQDLTDTKIDRQWSLGGGIGAYFGRSARVDATIERRFKTDVKGTFLAFDPNSCTLCPVHGTNSLQSTVLMANFYYDFNRGSHFTPYVGVGLGAVRHEVGAGRFSSGDGKLFGTIDGDQVKLQSTERAPGDAITFTFAGSFADGAISGPVYMGEYLNAKFTATRHAYPANRGSILIPGGPPLAN